VARVSGEVAVDADVAAFLREGVAVVVATRDAELRPEITRGWAPVLSADGCSLRLCVSAEPGSRTIANLEQNGDLAATFSLPSTYRSVQIKGAMRELREPTPDELALVRAHLGARFAEPPFITVTIGIRALFDQTPGARAGSEL
jgi:Pyridoxamine 5'-phosphate oxidase